MSKYDRVDIGWRIIRLLSSPMRTHTHSKSVDGRKERMDKPPFRPAQLLCQLQLVVLTNPFPLSSSSLSRRVSSPRYDSARLSVTGNSVKVNNGKGSMAKQPDNVRHILSSCAFLLCYRTVHQGTN